MIAPWNRSPSCRVDSVKDCKGHVTVEELDTIADTTASWLSGLMTTEIYNGQSLND